MKKTAAVTVGAVMPWMKTVSTGPILYLLVPALNACHSVLWVV